MVRFFCTVVLFSFSLPVFAAPMLRVIDVTGSRTIVVERAGVAQSITLAGVNVPSGDEHAATAYLRQVIESSWVALETDANGEAHVYRSPDGLYVNGELARRAYASMPNVHMTYLGEGFDGAPAVARPKSPATATAKPAPPPRSKAPAKPAPPRRGKRQTIVRWPF